MLDNFLNTGKFKVTFNGIGKYYKNICYLNDTRRRVTAERCKRLITENKSNSIKTEFKYDNKKEVYDVAVGMQIIATQNMKKHDIYNTMEFEIEDINDDIYRLRVNDVWFEKKEFGESFIP